MIGRKVLAVLSLLLFWAGVALAQPQPVSPSPFPPPVGPPPPPKTSTEAVLVPDTGGVRIGPVAIDAEKRAVRFSARVNQNEGLLEYALVSEQGKVHESLLRTEVEPYDLQVALLLLGLKGGGNLQFQGDPTPPKGDPVRITVEWPEGDGVKSVRLEDLIWNERQKKAMDHADWVFTGSRFLEGVFLAQMERSIVAVFRDPAAIIDNPQTDAADDTVWFPRKDLVPPPGTAVIVTIQVVKP